MNELPKMVDILLVEDDPDDTFLTKEAFAQRKLRASIHTVRDGVEALAFLRRQGEYAGAPRPDLILLDLELPRKGGAETLAEIRADEGLRSIPIVVLTSSGLPKDIQQSYLRQANSYIQKPVGFDQFTELVETLSDFWFTFVELPRKPS